MTSRRTRGLTLTDVVVMLGAVALLLSMAGRAARNGNEISNRIRCASNVKQMYLGMYLYSTNDRAGSFPRTKFVPGAPPTQYTGAAAADPFGSAGPAANDVSACLFLIFRTQDVSANAFVCPSTRYTPWAAGSPGKSALDFSNFSGNQNLAYSLANPYPSRAAQDNGYKYNNSLNSEFVLAADMNPGSPELSGLTAASPAAELRKGNSKNHGGQGQNVLYGDGHVSFENTPFCGGGMRGVVDCIYTVAGGSGSGPFTATSPTIVGSPTHPMDSVLLPVATVDAGYTDPARQVSYIIIGIAVAGGLIGLILWAVLRKRKPVTPIYEGQPFPNAGYPNAGYPPQQAYAAPPPPPPGRRGPPPLPPRQ